MDEVISLYKPIGATPFQLIQKLKTFDQKFQDIKIGYAGRLDPLAHGVILLTVGDGNKNRKKYLELNKSYDFSILFGVKTDSFDYLGVLESLDASSPPEDIRTKIQNFIDKNVGVLNQKYPPFSSQPVNGVPLYKLAKKGLINPESIPFRKIEIYDFKLNALEEITAKSLRKNILSNLRKVKGHFRQIKIINLWQKFFEENSSASFQIAHFSINCSTGTYVRSLADRMGEELGCGAIAYEIYRTKIGDFKVEEALNTENPKI